MAQIVRYGTYRLTNCRHSLQCGFFALSVLIQATSQTPITLDHENLAMRQVPRRFSIDSHVSSVSSLLMLFEAGSRFEGNRAYLFAVIRCEMRLVAGKNADLTGFSDQAGFWFAFYSFYLGTGCSLIEKSLGPLRISVHPRNHSTRPTFFCRFWPTLKTRTHDPLREAFGAYISTGYDRMRND